MIQLTCALRRFDRHLDQWRQAAPFHYFQFTNTGGGVPSFTRKAALNRVNTARSRVEPLQRALARAVLPRQLRARTRPRLHRQPQAVTPKAVPPCFVTRDHQQSFDPGALRHSASHFEHEVTFAICERLALVERASHPGSSRHGRSRKLIWKPRRRGPRVANSSSSTSIRYTSRLESPPSWIEALAVASPSSGARHRRRADLRTWG
jgi:hypothetical protein